MSSPVGIAVVGPTAVGKSDLAVEIALRVGGEVINADSMQLYRGMDIGTAKLTLEERRGVRHHLLDVLDVRQDATVAAYQELARRAVDVVRGRGAVPVLVGGSGLYVAAVVSNLDFPGTDPAVRSRLEGELAATGPAALHARLAAVDPSAAAVISPANGRKLVRALEVVEITGASFQAVLPELAQAGSHEWVRIGLTAPRPVLAERVEARVERMWARGLIDEVRRLEDEGIRQGRTASRALGYAQVLALLAARTEGAMAAPSEQQVKEQIVAATRRFVRRQESWFRRDSAIHWLQHDDPDLLERALRWWQEGQAAGGATESTAPR